MSEKVTARGSKTLLPPPSELLQMPTGAELKKAGWMAMPRRDTEKVFERMLKNVKTKWDAVKEYRWPQGPKGPEESGTADTRSAFEIDAMAAQAKAQCDALKIFIPWEELKTLPRRSAK